MSHCCPLLRFAGVADLAAVPCLPGSVMYENAERADRRNVSSGAHKVSGRLGLRTQQPIQNITLPGSFAIARPDRRSSQLDKGSAQCLHA